MEQQSPVERIQAAGQVAWAIVGIALALGVAGWLGWKLAVVFPPLIFAGAIVFLLNPIVSRLQRRGIPRPMGVAATYLGFVGAIVVLGFLFVPAIQAQTQDFSDQWPEAREKLENWVDDRAASFEGTPLEFNREDVMDSFTTNDDSVRDQISRVFKIGSRVFHMVLVLVLGPVFAFYLLIDLSQVRRNAESLVPEPLREEAIILAREIGQVVGGFFRGQLAVALIVGVLASIGLWAIGLKYWLLIGMVAGGFNMIPLVGPYIGGVPGVFVALTTDEPITAAWVILVMVVVQQIDNHFISPVVMHRMVKLHPVIVMLALLVGGTLSGLYGMLVAVPTAAVLKILLGHIWRVHVLGEPLDQWVQGQAREELRPGVGIVEDIGGDA